MTASLVDLLYSLNAVLLLVVAITSARYWLTLPSRTDRVGLVVMAIVALTLSDSIRYWWFAAYRIADAPAWMLDHWTVALFTALGTAGALLFLKLYVPVCWRKTMAFCAALVALILWRAIP